jgi:hypothetical protein
MAFIKLLLISALITYTVASPSNVSYSINIQIILIISNISVWKLGLGQSQTGSFGHRETAG